MLRCDSSKAAAAVVVAEQSSSKMYCGGSTSKLLRTFALSGAVILVLVTGHESWPVRPVGWGAYFIWGGGVECALKGEPVTSSLAMQY